MADNDDEFYTPKHGGKSYISILSVTDAAGKPDAVFAEKCQEGDDGAVSRKNKKGVTVWERHHGAMRFYIRQVWIVPADKSEYGAQLCIASDKRIIQVPFNSRHARKFIAVCHNIDLDEKVLIKPYRMPREKDGKPIINPKSGQKVYNTGWTIRQGGDSKENNLEEALDMSKDGPVPEWRKLKNGKYDTSDQDEYLENYLQKWIDKNDLGKKQEASVTEDEEEEEVEEEDEEEAPPMKKANAKVVSSKPSKAAQADMDEEEDDIP